MSRLPDKVRVELVDTPAGTFDEPGAGRVFDKFTSLQVVNDVTMPSEASFELGDDGSWRAIEQYVAHGARYRVFVNDRQRLTGRLEVSDIPQDAQAGSVIRFTVRTKLQDAWYASADEKVSVKNVSLGDFLVALYEPLGYTIDDFEFRASVGRDLLTGRSSTNQGDDGRDVERVKVDAARVRPPETIYAAADRHLRRHGLMHWDSPDGRIIVSAPNDDQDPLYHLVATRAGRGLSNNVLSMTRSQDWSSIPTTVGLYGVGGKRGTARARVSAVTQDDDLVGAGFHRPVTILAEAVKTQELADRAARRELSARSKSKDAFDVEVDGLTHWTGQDRVPYGVDTVASVETDSAGGRVGAYYLHRVQLRRDAGKGDVANLSLLKKGVWRL